MTTPRDPRSNSKRTKGGPARAGYDDKRYRANRDRLKQIGNHTCHVCGTAIDMQLVWPHPLCWTADHVIPRAHLHPNDPRHWQIEFLREAHKRCNESRGAKPIAATPPQGLDTSIEW